MRCTICDVRLAPDDTRLLPRQVEDLYDAHARTTHHAPRSKACRKRGRTDFRGEWVRSGLIWRAA